MKTLLSGYEILPKTSGAMCLKWNHLLYLIFICVAFEKEPPTNSYRISMKRNDQKTASHPTHSPKGQIMQFFILKSNVHQGV